MIIVLVFALVLTTIIMALAYLVSTETRGVGFQLDDTKALYLAQAGIERAFREIRDDILTTTQTGVADLRGADTSLSASIGSPGNMRYIDTSTATINSNTDQAILRTFDSNYRNTRIISVELHARASRGGGAGSNPTMQVSYTTDGASYTIAITQTLTSTSLTDFSADITGSLTWATIMSSNFRLRTMRTGGTRNINLDSMYLRVTYGIDTLTEPWATGSYASFPITLGDGTMQSVSIIDEARKVHLNYASQLLLSNLLQNLGISSASAKATDIVNYRGAALTNPFDSVEELQQVSSITASDYSTIKDYVTVYSFINTSSYRPPASGTTSRAPININTASFQVLKAEFDPLGLGAGDSTSLANDIITFRNTTPFTCFYSSDAAVTTDFYDFARSRAYLSTAGNPDEQDRVLDNADASSLIPVSGSTSFSAVTTEFCYATTNFKVESVGRIGDINTRVKTIVGDDGSRTFQNFTGDGTLTGYWKENYE